MLMILIAILAFMAFYSLLRLVPQVGAMLLVFGGIVWAYQNVELNSHTAAIALLAVALVWKLRKDRKPKNA